MSDDPISSTADTPGRPVVHRLRSQEAFRKLTDGKVINQYQVIDGVLEPNPLFDELYKERDRYYVEAYANMGLELVQRPGFFYVRSLVSDADEEGRDQDSTAAIRQIQGVLLVLGRGVLEAGYLFEVLTRHEAGVSPELLESIGESATMRQILAACNVDYPLSRAVKVALVDRDIAYYNSRGHLVLSDAGKAFFEDLFAQG
ncbi:hypothetical protein LRB11_14760 [Ectothiorhodospira haloalkaliphila]|uniref:condensin complex protein MksE n=1 Tax=Ectothiorhodospira haloalkaliphila TaxID=421628 RepID=UPI001EE7EE70|nr:hypothetical protein [Ectothiorhodospira haloalkaliphila]MCG5526176.1 hypothetical protein [Ectothiorhodospira haloalkaliphila]